MTKSTTSDSVAIEMRDVTKTYSSGKAAWGRADKKVTALDRLNLSVRKGHIYGMVGESGSGKTTAGRLIMRLEQPDSGSIKVLGEPIARLKSKALKQFRRRVQMVFQDPYQSLNPYMSVIDAVAEPLYIHTGISRGKARDKVAQALETAGLTPAGDYFRGYPHQLSGGQRQRVAIARAMILEPDVMVADEPTSMLDASIAVQIYQLLANIQRRRRMTLVLITHNLAAANYLCDRIAVIYRGHIVETGKTAAIIKDPRHPYTQALLDALPRFGNTLNNGRFNTLRSQERPAGHGRGENCPFFSRCDRAQEDLCGTSKPSLISLGDEHRAACFFANDQRPGKF